MSDSLQLFVRTILLCFIPIKLNSQVANPVYLRRVRLSWNSECTGRNKDEWDKCGGLCISENYVNCYSVCVLHCEKFYVTFCGRRALEVYLGVQIEDVKIS